MSQKPSLPQSPQTVQLVLTGNTQKVTPHSPVWIGRRIDHFHHEEWFVILELNSTEPPEIILLHVCVANY